MTSRIALFMFTTALVLSALTVGFQIAHLPTLPAPVTVEVEP